MLDFVCLFAFVECLIGHEITQYSYTFISIVVAIIRRCVCVYISARSGLVAMRNHRHISHCAPNLTRLNLTDDILHLFADEEGELCRN
uniref:Putative secreted protein n=1 Tax=Anopheles marajoara TaxID=58244 RepID=A0A2M4CAA7_9DIPT